MNKATMITQNQDDPLTGMTAEGRPVRFSESMWAWIYDDTPGEDAVEKVENAQLIRSHYMDINDIALQFCGLLSIGKKASPEIMGMLRKSLKQGEQEGQIVEDGGQWFISFTDDNGVPYYSNPFSSEEEARSALVSGNFQMS